MIIFTILTVVLSVLEKLVPTLLFSRLFVYGSCAMSFVRDLLYANKTIKTLKEKVFEICFTILCYFILTGRGDIVEETIKEKLGGEY